MNTPGHIDNRTSIQQLADEHLRNYPISSNADAGYGHLQPTIPHTAIVLGGLHMPLGTRPPGDYDEPSIFRSSPLHVFLDVNVSASPSRSPSTL